MNESVTTYAPQASVDNSLAPLPAATALESIAPNPVAAGSATEVRAEFSLSAAATVSFRVVDILGNRIVRTAPRSYTAGTFDIPIDCSQLHAGAYAVVLNAGAETRVKWMIVRP